MRSLRRLVMMLLMLLVLAAVTGGIAAQQATPTPYPVPEPAIGEVSANPIQFRDQQIRLDGLLVEFVNPNAFVISDSTVGEYLPVLVINNSGLPLPNELVKFSEVNFVGRGIPSAASVADGSIDALPSYYETRVALLNNAHAPESTAEPTPQAVAGNEVDPSVVETGFSGDAVFTLPYQQDMMAWLYSGLLPPEYADYAVIELTDLNSLLITSDEAVG